MSAPDTPRYAPDWLTLRESADAQARATEPLRSLRERFAGPQRTVVHDLGCGTGSMGRWLAPRLPGPQHWVLYDIDADLLDHARASMAGAAADGTPVTVETRQGDITALTAADLAGVHLVTASALLDLLTRDEVGALATACAGARCPALLTLSVVGMVRLEPPDPIDSEVAAAFNGHQRRAVGHRRLLGPDAVDAAAEAFARVGATVAVRPSPWRLGAAESALTAEWLRGWVRAACDQEPLLANRAEAYLERRVAAAQAGRLHVVLQHADLFACFE